MQYFESLPLSRELSENLREQPQVKFRVTSELVKKTPSQVAHLYMGMPVLVASKNSGLMEINYRVIELHADQNNWRENLGPSFLSASLAGTVPPLLLSCFADLDEWTELMGLVLLSGFCPCALAGLPPSELLRRNAPIPKAILYSGYHPSAEKVLEQACNDQDPSYRIQDPSWLRLDSLTNSQKDSVIHITLRQQFRKAIGFLLPRWIEKKRNNEGLQAAINNYQPGELMLTFPPSEFVRWAINIGFSIPWLDFAKEHFPYLLPKDSSKKPIPDDLAQATIEKVDVPDKRAETTYLNIIGAMLDLMLGESKGGQKHCLFKNQTTIIEALLAHNPGKPGITQRTLEDKFAAAKRKLNET